MALYEYRCDECGTTFEVQRPMAESALPSTCPDGHQGARRVFSVFAAVGAEAGAGAGSAATGAAPRTGPCGHACACAR